MPLHHAAGATDERVQLNDAGQVELKLKTRWRDGTTHLVTSPLQFLQRLAALVPRSRFHQIKGNQPPKPTRPPNARSRRPGWAQLLKRVFDIDMPTCPNCGGGELKIIAATLERPVIEKILTHLSLWTCILLPGAGGVRPGKTDAT